jgi:hypothetical protein
MQLTADEVDRFWSRVVKGPRETDCWLWAGGGTAAIADDGYGRFWISREGRQRVLRPHRVAWALAEGVSIDLSPVVEHVVCDNPICVRAEGTLLDHLEGSTQAANLSRIAQHGRGGARGYRSRMFGRGRCTAGRSRCEPRLRTAGMTSGLPARWRRSTRRRWHCSEAPVAAGPAMAPLSRCSEDSVAARRDFAEIPGLGRRRQSRRSREGTFQ